MAVLIAAGGWIVLSIVGRSFLPFIAESIRRDDRITRFLAFLAALMLPTAALVLAGARRCLSGKAGGRKVLLTGLGLFHCLAFIVTMVQFTWLPELVRDVHPAADPFRQLVHRQHVLLATTLAAWCILALFDAWLATGLKNSR